jgi:FkbM family methyltransferase
MQVAGLAPGYVGWSYAHLRSDLAASLRVDLTSQRHKYVGHGSLLRNFPSGAFAPSEISMAMSVLNLRRQYFKEGVFAIDCGANIGIHTVEWAKHMTGWGSVLAIEAQERIYYALAGNIAINNCFNAAALNAAITDKVLMMPQPDYLAPASFGSLELRKSSNTEFIGQPIDYSGGNLRPVQGITIDSLKLSRIDFIKVDIEGMEMEALAGAAQSIANNKPVLLIETIKAGATTLCEWLMARDYKVFHAGINALAVHTSDPVLRHVKQNQGT